MLYNHARILVQDWDGKSESYCPSCEVPLVAKRGTMVTWHWAHHPNSNTSCTWEETDWHLRWKMVYASMPGWQVEVPFKVGEITYRLDAFNPTTNRIREFVHTLSYSYAAKHLALSQCESRPDICWIWDGEAFKSAWAKTRYKLPMTGAYLINFMKPSPYLYFRTTGGLLHWKSALWRDWAKASHGNRKGNIWFEVNGDRIAYLLSAYDRQGRKVGEIKHEESGTDRENAVSICQDPNIGWFARVPGQVERVETDREATRSHVHDPDGASRVLADYF